MDKILKLFFVIVFVACTVVAVALWQGLTSILFAWVLNLMLMVGVLYITQTFKPRLISTYYNSNKWEAEGKIYKWFGVDEFRKVLVWVGWEKINKASNPVKKNLDALRHLEYSTRQSELGHLIIFFIVSIFTLFVASHYGVIQASWLFLLNVILNVYPIGVQRYNRPRLRKAILRIEGF